jgi:hypothetical protein
MTVQSNFPLHAPEIESSSSVIVLLDPTSDDGEAALAALSDADTNVALLVLASGPCSHAIRDYARAEDIDLSAAAWYYLEQVERRTAKTGRLIELIVATGPDAGNELAHLAVERPYARIALPESSLRVDRRLRRRLSYLTQVDVYSPASTSA